MHYVSFYDKYSPRNFRRFILFTLGFWGIMMAVATACYGQTMDNSRQLEYSQQFRLGDRIIRIAEPGQLADTVNVWGEVNSPGRYLIPLGTTLPELLSYSLGPSEIRDRATTLNWSKVRVEVSVSSYNNKTNEDDAKTFHFRYDRPLPNDMWTYQLKNDQVVSVQVRRRPSFVDYVGVVAPVISAIATSIIIVDRLSR